MGYCEGNNIEIFCSIIYAACSYMLVHTMYKYTFEISIQQTIYCISRDGCWSAWYNKVECSAFYKHLSGNTFLYKFSFIII